MMRNVQELMTKDLTTCLETSPVAEAAKLMERDDVGSIPVLEDGKLVGIVTDRDIALRVVAAGRDPRQTRIQDVMTRDPEAVTVNDSIDKVMEVMESRQVRRIPVIDQGRRLVGIIAQADIARLGNDHATGDVVEAISKK